nr:MAG TPA: Terminase small subunit [Caudoviricetes sp.]
MAAKKNPLSDKAYQMYKQGMKLVDIAEQLGCSPATVRTWKNRHKWDEDESETFQKKNETKRNVSTKNTKSEMFVDDGTRETLRNDELTAEQQMFCIYYSRTFNAAQSYQKAYGCTYESAIANGSRLLTKDKVRAEIERLKELKRQQIVTSTEDVVELQMRIAFADIGNYMSFGRENVQVMGAFGPVKDPDTKQYLTKEVNTVRLSDSNNVDTQIIQEVKQGKDGVSIKLADKQKAFDWLTKYFLMHPESKYRVEYERRRAEKEGGESSEHEDDGFMDALQGDVAATFKEDDAVET